MVKVIEYRQLIWVGKHRKDLVLLLVLKIKLTAEIEYSKFYFKLFSLVKQF